MFTDSTTAQDLALSERVSQAAHRGQVYGDVDYFEGHVRVVTARVAADPRSSAVHVVVANFHDVVEDTDVTLGDLRTLGFSEIVVAAVDAITRRAGEPYAAFIARACLNPIAALVKLHDVMVNLAAHGKPSLRRRYLAALPALEAAVGGAGLPDGVGHSQLDDWSAWDEDDAAFARPGAASAAIGEST